MNLIDKVESMGYNVLVQHFRYDKLGQISTVGRNFVSKAAAFGMVRCSPEDTFRKREGWNKALGRALSKIK